MRILKILLIPVVLMLFSSSMKGQIGTNLEFSQTITVSVPNGSAPGNIVSIGTVPPGKIWKVVGASMPYFDTGIITDYVVHLNVGSTKIYIALFDFSEKRFVYAHFPLFFNENQTLTLESNLGGPFATGTVSIIEYTVLP